MMDYRIKENRREAFVTWWAWSLYYGDCDPAVWITNYINDRYEHNIEQKLWLCWIYGNTYNLPSSWVIMNEFPDFELATVSRMEDWNTKNYHRLRYQVDTKWNKGHLPVMFKSYQDFIGEASQRERFAEICNTDDPHQNFDNLWSEVKSNLHKFGRYSTWFYLQHLKSTAGLNIEPTSLMLSDYSGSRSHRNGLLYALGREELVDEKLTKEQYNELETQADGILSEVKERFPEIAHQADRFMMETALCSFKKIFRERKGRYLGYYLDRQSEEIMKCEGDSWYGIQWDVLWQAREETLKEDILSKRKAQIDKSKFTYFLETGKLERSNWLFNEKDPDVGLEEFFV